MGILLEGQDNLRSIKIFENVVDEDLSHMYPAIILANNIDAETMLGKVYFDESLPNHTVLTETFADMMAEDDVLKIGKELLGLPNLEDVIDNLEEYLA